MIKISFLGDIMCEPLLLRSAERKNGTYDFSKLFTEVRALFEESDFVAGNLETPLAGKEAQYVKDLFSFNAPDAFAQAIREAGIDFVSTANNHCMDRGIEGLVRTVRVLDSIGLAHGGTVTECKQEPYPFVTDVEGTKVSIICFTCDTNYRDHHNELPDESYAYLLRPQTDPTYSILQPKKGGSRMKKAILSKLRQEDIIRIKKMLGKEYYRARKDDYLDEKSAEPYFLRLKKAVDRAKEVSDIVIFYPHVGGQFNLEPGKFTEYAVEKALSYGVDAIIASHPHIVQRAMHKKGVPVFYSIGNFSMSPNSVYLLHENLPDYGLAVHLYIEEKKIQETTFSILKIVEEKRKMLTVWPVDRFYAECNERQKQEVELHIQQIYQTVAKKALTDHIVQREYLLE